MTSPRRRDPSEPLKGVDGVNVDDFWSWAYSDFLSNTNRSVLAEFIVGKALGVVEGVRVEWDAVDFRYRERSIEVKSSAYCQSWHQDRPSRIIYEIAKKRPWYPATNTFGLRPVRSADCYVFCLHQEQDPSCADPLDVRQWEFYVISKHKLENQFADRKTLGLKAVRSLAGPVTFVELREAVDRVLG